LTTPILNITEVANNQVDQYATVNEALRALESAGNNFFELDLSSSDLTIPNASPDFIFSRNVVFKTTGNAVSRVLTVPVGKRLFIVQNGGSSSLTVKRGTAEFALAAGNAAVFYADGTTNGLINIVAGSADWGSIGGTITAQSDLVNYINFVTVAESTTARALVLSDAQKFIDCTNASGCEITVPPQSSVAWADNTMIMGIGRLNNVVFAEGSGVDIIIPSGRVLESYDRAVWSLRRLAADVWCLTGYLVSA
jgi:hypothetical protein